MTAAHQAELSSLLPYQLRMDLFIDDELLIPSAALFRPFLRAGVQA